MKIFTKILIANRGEIALRIIRSAQKLGIRTVAVYSEVDRDSLHVEKADEAYCIGNSDLSETYLNVQKIIDVALRAGCDAIHPGYGFLAENTAFVKACEKANLVFIGPSSEAIRLMGNKIESREFVSRLGIPMTKGITGEPHELLKKVGTIPFPVLVKAAAGGGGKGMRIVMKKSELKGILETTGREAKNYFGDGTIYIEKYIENPRHIEFQILGDNQGNVVHLFERECSIQRRYQKIIEESPSATLTPELREQMGKAAVKIAREIKYNSAGTIEFLVDDDLNFYFLEMNTRIQVEHPVTEMVTGVDLVEKQILVAAGNPLDLSQEKIRQKGHAIECRVYAEDPSNNFMPSPGTITLYREPEGKNIRVDSAINRPVDIYSFFDPMIAKLIVWDNSRDNAIKKSVDALAAYVIHGISTNLSYLRGILQHEAFRTNQLSTNFCDSHSDEILEKINFQHKKTGTLLPAMAFLMHSVNHGEKTEEKNVWKRIGFWRSNPEIPLSVDDNDLLFEIDNNGKQEFAFHIEKKVYQTRVLSTNSSSVKFRKDKKEFTAFLSTDSKVKSWVSIGPETYQVKRKDFLTETDELILDDHSDDKSSLFAPMPGKVVKVNVKKGDKVKRGTIMLVVEAMKMENNLTAIDDALIKDIIVTEGDMVDTDKQLVYLEYINDK